MTDTLITEAEIKILRVNAKTITLEDALRGPRVKVTPLILASGYKVSMSLNDAGTGRVIEHVSVYNPSGRRTDPADAEIIAAAVLGEGYSVLGDGELLKENKHFIKIVNWNHKMRPLNHKLRLWNHKLRLT